MSKDVQAFYDKIREQTYGLDDGTKNRIADWVNRSHGYDTDAVLDWIGRRGAPCDLLFASAIEAVTEAVVALARPAATT